MVIFGIPSSNAVSARRMLRNRELGDRELRDRGGRAGVWLAGKGLRWICS